MQRLFLERAWSVEGCEWETRSAYAKVRGNAPKGLFRDILLGRLEQEKGGRPRSPRHDLFEGPYRL